MSKSIQQMSRVTGIVSKKSCFSPLIRLGGRSLTHRLGFAVLPSKQGFRSLHCFV